MQVAKKKIGQSPEYSPVAKKKIGQSPECSAIGFLGPRSCPICHSSMCPGSDSSFHCSTSCLSPMKVLNFRMILSSTDTKWDLVVVALLSKFPSSEVVPEVASKVSKFPILQQLPSLLAF